MPKSALLALFKIVLCNHSVFRRFSHLPLSCLLSGPRIMLPYSLIAWKTPSYICVQILMGNIDFMEFYFDCIKG